MQLYLEEALLIAFISSITFILFVSIFGLTINEVDYTDQTIINLQNQLESKQTQIEQLELMQPPDYSSTIIFGVLILFLGSITISYMYFENKERITKMQLESQKKVK